jgi:DNA-binding response OmpR family regulator
MPMATILCIHDEEQARALYKVALEESRYRVLTAENRAHGLRLLEQQPVNLILIDIFIPDMDGLELILQLQKIRPGHKMIVLSGGARYLDLAKHLGANDTLQKPFSVQDLLARVSSHLTVPRVWDNNLADGNAGLQVERLVGTMRGCGG